MTPKKKAIPILAGLAVTAGGGFAALTAASPPSGPALTGVAANTRSDGYAPASSLSPELRQIVVAQGATKLENTSTLTSYYGYDNDTVNSAGQPVMVPFNSTSGEAMKTEPDKNTYLVFKKSLSGADDSYDYGTRFLFQGHEGGTGGASGITRINLDADPAHRVTLLATKDAGGNNISTIDGSTWDPWAKRLLFTTENSSAPSYSATPGYPSTVTDISGALGRGGYEGIQNDSSGNVWIVEDIGGSNKNDPNNGNAATKAKRPNSFVYRYVPAAPGNLNSGRLQALQVLSNDPDHDPITFESQAALNNPDQVALHSYGNTFDTKWVTVHDTATDGTAPFNANDAAKAHQATPFKRPENGRFRPGSNFKEFYFDETGDTDNTSLENATAGGWGGIQKLVQAGPSANSGKLTLFYKGNQEHTGLDNASFLDKEEITFVEDAGDTLHKQRNALDSGWVFDVNVDYSQGAQPSRWLAEGRDAAATIDSANGGFGKNDQDNEITGTTASDGDPRKEGILGAKDPRLFDGEWRWFYTQQHGDNTTYEVVAAP
jgi:hypothetical protein